MTSGLAKVILLGEHAVVYGHPALAGALDRRVRCRAAGKSAELSLRCRQWQIDVSMGDDHPVARALRLIAAELDVSPAMSLEIDTTVPEAAGLGSSAALTVAVTRCLAENYRRSLSTEEVERIANIGEHAFHANPSGVDVALAVRGGIGTYTKSSGLVPVAARELPIAIGLSGERRSTGAMVERVAEQMRADEKRTSAILQAMGDAARSATKRFESGIDLGELGVFFDAAQSSLRSLGLSSAKIDELVELAKGAGAAGAKLTGAGGGGAVIAVGDDPAEIVRAWRTEGFFAFTAMVGARP